MGVDIHLGIATRDGKYIYNEIFDGRNSEWFGNISGDVRGMTGEIYHTFPRIPGIPDKAPEELVKAYKEDYYGFNYVKVGDFLDWFEKARPDIDAGWVTTYDKWLYEKKGVAPESKYYLDSEDNINDYHFIEIENKWDCSRWLYDFVTDRGDSIDIEDYIVYYFDC